MRAVCINDSHERKVFPLTVSQTVKGFLRDHDAHARARTHGFDYGKTNRLIKGETIMKFISLTLITSTIFAVCFFVGTSLTIGTCLLVNAMIGASSHYQDLVQSGLVLTIGFVAGCVIFSKIVK